MNLLTRLLRLLLGGAMRPRYRPRYGRRPSHGRRPFRPMPLPAMPPDGELRGTCHVIDGDTIVIGRTKVRLAGVDAPELDQPYGQKAKWAMVEIWSVRRQGPSLAGLTSMSGRGAIRLVISCFSKGSWLPSWM